MKRADAPWRGGAIISRESSSRTTGFLLHTSAHARMGVGASNFDGPSAESARPLPLPGRAANNFLVNVFFLVSQRSSAVTATAIQPPNRRHASRHGSPSYRARQIPPPLPKTANTTEGGRPTPQKGQRQPASYLPNRHHPARFYAKRNAKSRILRKRTQLLRETPPRKSFR